MHVAIPMQRKCIAPKRNEVHTPQRKPNRNRAEEKRTDKKVKKKTNNDNRKYRHKDIHIIHSNLDQHTYSNMRMLDLFLFPALNCSRKSMRFTSKLCARAIYRCFWIKDDNGSGGNGDDDHDEKLSSSFLFVCVFELYCLSMGPISGDRWRITPLQLLLLFALDSLAGIESILCICSNFKMIPLG